MTENISFYKDESLSFVLNYKSIPFEANGKDTGFIIRAIEINHLFMLRNKINTLGEIIGFSFSNSMPTAKEMKLLIDKGNQLLEKYIADCDVQVQKLEDAETYLENLSEGRLRKPNNYRTTHAWASDSYDNVERARGCLGNAQDKLSKISGVYGLLRPVVEQLLKENVTGYKSEFLISIPNEKTTTNSLNSNMNWDYSNECNLILDECENLKNHINKIVGDCYLSTDKYVRRNTSDNQLNYYKEYYDINNKSVNTVLTADEYVSKMVSIQKRIQSKLDLM
ncbi:TPA: hypothetical protein U2M30_000453 [Providencia stuartii]|uniref:hypothetical protein n=1 Tax=Providencia TaxID=586 RepID=UPI00123A5A09|nr:MULTISPECIES: hypothetical protein [Providencia]QET96908.1 hypothetical protein FOB53_06325 [Providencia stuartii]HEM8142364.1 hypothetical protein [Providencia stuartii]HEM8873480.1 hypothetical protein [Providencia stuartii]